MLTEKTFQITKAAEINDFHEVEKIQNNLSETEKLYLIPLVQSAMFFYDIAKPIQDLVLQILNSKNTPLEASSETH